MSIPREFTLAITFLVLLAACKPTPQGQRAPIAEASGETKKYADGESMRVTSGQLNWTASKPTKQHLGTVEIEGGTVQVKGTDLLGGNLEVDMTTVSSIDLEGEMKQKLESHLKSEDFFDVQKFPTASFTVTSVSRSSEVPMATHRVTGDLEIKGIVKSVTVPVNISFVGDKLLAATPAFTIDRTAWDIKYMSGLIGTAADKLIHDEISLVITFDAQK